MTKLVTSVMTNGPESALAYANQAIAEGADLIEFRLDGWDDPNDGFEKLCPHLPGGRWILTCRTAWEGGAWRGAEEDRLALMLRALRENAGYVDFEYAEWRGSPAVRRRFAEALGNGAHTPRLILSAHDFNANGRGIIARLPEMLREASAYAVKLAWSARDITDNFTALDLLRRANRPAAIICMGRAGLMSRVLSRKFGGFAAYCAPAGGNETAPGQVSLEAMRKTYRWDAISPATRVFGVIGDPVRHSMSPVLFNACFDRAGLDAIYLPLLVDRAPGVLQRFLRGCLARPWLDVGGFSVTMPHKTAARRFAETRPDAQSKRIGAVNTLVLRERHFIGHNTDCDGALDAICERVQCERGDLANLDTVVLGAGGVARALISGLTEHRANVRVYNRSANRGNRLAEEFGCEARPWDQRDEADTADLVVNCTSVGMHPDENATPLPGDCLKSGAVLFDTVYNPLQTRLLREADQAGCRTIDGLSLFVNQAARQLELWTQTPADRHFIRETVQWALTNRPTSS